MSALVTQDFIWEDGHCTVMARMADRPTAPNTAGTALTQASFSSISYSVHDSSNVVVSGHDAQALTIASVVFDTLQGWSRDSTGHNFRYTVAAGAFATGDSVYTITVKFTLTSGVVGYASYRVTTVAIPIS